MLLRVARATYDYPDRGFGPMPSAEVHHATLVILAASTAEVMSVADLSERVTIDRDLKDVSSRAT
jgi:biuret amidohydrolase